ncbi:hypothetical protein DB29_03374 [Shouchella clausii]|nr:hypothetical protein DB29_03374 [Shouchella clausii]
MEINGRTIKKLVSSIINKSNKYNLVATKTTKLHFSFIEGDAKGD